MQWHKPTTQCLLPGCHHTECLPPAELTNTTIPSSTNSSHYHIASKNNKGQILLNKAYRLNTHTTSPFGTAPGFETNLGIVAPPQHPIDGYIYTQQGWKIYATPKRQIPPPKPNHHNHTYTRHSSKPPNQPRRRSTTQTPHKWPHPYHNTPNHTPVPHYPATTKKHPNNTQHLHHTPDVAQLHSSSTEAPSAPQPHV